MSSLGIEPSDQGGIYFKWADNPQSLDNIISLCTDGDTAPNRRFAYNYSWNLTQSGFDDTTLGASLKATPIAGAIHVECNLPFSIYNLSGLKVGGASSSATITVPGPGLYIVASSAGSQKVTVY